MSDISHLLAPSYLEIYEKNREFIENNLDYKFIPPKGENLLEDKPENIFNNPNTVKVIEEDKIPLKIIDTVDEKKK
jgi:hypothetical protein